MTGYLQGMRLQLPTPNLTLSSDSGALGLNNKKAEKKGKWLTLWANFNPVVEAHYLIVDL